MKTSIAAGNPTAALSLRTATGWTGYRVAIRVSGVENGRQAVSPFDGDARRPSGRRRDGRDTEVKHPGDQTMSSAVKKSSGNETLVTDPGPPKILIVDDIAVERRFAGGLAGGLRGPARGLRREQYRGDGDDRPGIPRRRPHRPPDAGHGRARTRQGGPARHPQLPSS